MRSTKISPEGFCIYPHLYEARAFKGKGDAKYSIEFITSDGESLVSDWNDAVNGFKARKGSKDPDVLKADILPGYSDALKAWKILSEADAAYYRGKDVPANEGDYWLNFARYAEENHEPVSIKVINQYGDTMPQQHIPYGTKCRIKYWVNAYEMRGKIGASFRFSEVQILDLANNDSDFPIIEKVGASEDF